MRILSATDVAIAAALRGGSLAIRERDGRFGPFWSIEDAYGVIETALSRAEADHRVGAIRAALQ